MKKTVILLIFLLSVLVNVNAQNERDFVYPKLPTYEITKWNQIKVDLHQQLRNIEQKEGQTILHLDSSIGNTLIIYNNYGASKNGPFKLIENREKRTTKYSIKDIRNNTFYTLTTPIFKKGNSHYVANYQSCGKHFLFQYHTKKVKQELVVFDFDKLLDYKHRVDYYFLPPLGSTDTSFSFMSYDDRNDDSIQICSVSEGGIYEQLCFSNTYTPDSGLWFYNGLFTVTQKLMNRERGINGYPISQYNYFIYTKSLLRDSVEVTEDNSKYEYFDNITYYENNRNRLLLVYKDRLKVYHSNGLIHEWNSAEWENKIETLRKSKKKEYLLIGDSLYVVAQVDITTQAPILVANGTTLNGLPFDKNSTDYQTVLLFDITNNEFLGYPTIVFDKAQDSR